MAENKNSVVFYVSWGSVFDELSNEEAGRLIKHFLDYVRDKNPEPPDRITKLMFEPIKQQLKRDLKKWEAEVDVRSHSGREGNLKRWSPDLYKAYKAGTITLDEAEKQANDRKASQPDNSSRTSDKSVAKIAGEIAEDVNVVVDVNVVDTVIGDARGEEKKPKLKKKRQTKMFIAPTLEEVIQYFRENDYSADAARRAFNYYSVADWHDKNGDPVRNWKQKMQGNWFKPENLRTPKPVNQTSGAGSGLNYSEYDLPKAKKA